MRKLLTQWCAYVFPEREEHRLVRQLTRPEVLAQVRPTIVDEITSLLPFHEPAVRALIHEAKFHHNEIAWQLLADCLHTYLRHAERGTLVVPVPLSRSRRWQRGYNQVAEVTARAVADVESVYLITNALKRVRDTTPQTTLTKADRATNMIGAFRVVRADLIENAHILLIDDVTTTGATLKAAAAALKPHHPAAVTLLALAH